MRDDEAKKAILARRARFVAAAMLGTGLATCKSGPPADPSTVQAPEYPPASEPQVCLSPPPPQPCLSVTPPAVPADTALAEPADPADAGAPPVPPPHPCLSIRPRPCLKPVIRPNPKPEICLSFSP
jgi:hypothetical protein